MTNKYLPLLALVCTAFGVLLAGCAGSVPTNIGVQGGRLALCPSSPNCVSSYDIDERHGVAPVVLSGKAAEAGMAHVRQAVEALPGARVVGQGETYLRAEFASRVFGFVDDLECLYDASTHTVHMRSAARLGYYDFGVNRARIELLRELLSHQ